MSRVCATRSMAPCTMHRLATPLGRTRNPPCFRTFRCIPPRAFTHTHTRTRSSAPLGNSSARADCQARILPARSQKGSSPGGLAPIPEFDLGLAVALAGVAFESYLEPAGAEGFQEVSVSGCQTTYTDRDFLTKTYDGILHIYLRKGTGLAAADMNGKSDPYAVMSVGDSCARSSVVYADLNPVWNQKCVLYVRSKEDDVLKLRMFDKDLFSSDDDLGVVMCSLAGLKHRRRTHLELPLQGANATGTVSLTLTFLSFKEEDVADMVTADNAVLPTVTPAEAVAAAVVGKSAALANDVSLTVAAMVGTGTVASAAEVGGAVVGSVAGQLQQASAALEAAAAGAHTVRAEAQRAAATKLKEVVGDISLSGTISAATQRLAAVVQELESATQVGAVKSTLASGMDQGTAALEQLKGILEPLLRSSGSSKDAAAAASNPLLEEDAASSSLQAAESPSSESSPAAAPAAATASVSILDSVTAEELPTVWKVLASVAGQQVEDQFAPVAFVEEPVSDTQVWLYRNPVAREAVVSFRGTEQVKWKDFVTDLNLTPAAFNPERVDSNAGLPWIARALKIRKGEMMVHTGFLTAYDSVRARVMQLLDCLLATDRSGPWRVMVTGHSLGGALATICSLELANFFSTAGKEHAVTMYTYGAPRVGNAAFAEAFNAAVHDSWRITNWNDIIPTVPRLMGYCHVRHGARLQPDGTLQVEVDSADVFGEGKHAEEVMEELVKRVQAGTAGWEEVADEIKANELAMLEGLIAGRAIEEHLENFYLLTLQQLVVAAMPEAAAALESELAARLAVTAEAAAVTAEAAAALEEAKEPAASE